jgi:hypothetical protein
MSIIENERFDYMKRIVARDLPTYAGPVLEKLFIEIIGYSSDYGLIGTYWKKGNRNEIDIVAVDDVDKRIEVTEVKLNKEKIKINKLKATCSGLKKKYPGYDFEYRGLSLADIEAVLAESI